MSITILLCENTRQPRKSALQGPPETLSAYLSSFSSFFASLARDATAMFYGYLRKLFQSDRTTMLRVGEINGIDCQAMQHMLTSGAIDWNGFGGYCTLKEDNQQR